MPKVLPVPTKPPQLSLNMFIMNELVQLEFNSTNGKPVVSCLKNIIEKLKANQECSKMSANEIEEIKKLEAFVKQKSEFYSKSIQEVKIHKWVSEVILVLLIFILTFIATLYAIFDFLDKENKIWPKIVLIIEGAIIMVHVGYIVSKSFHLCFKETEKIDVEVCKINEPECLDLLDRQLKITKELSESVEPKRYYYASLFNYKNLLVLLSALLFLIFFLSCMGVYLLGTLPNDERPMNYIYRFQFSLFSATISAFVVIGQIYEIVKFNKIIC